MHVEAEAFWAPKAGSSEGEYEDAVWPVSQRGDCAVGFRCAVADGATETSYSRIWAKQLVSMYAYDKLNGPSNEELSLARASWQRHVDKRLSGSNAWYAEAKARSGAFAALVTLTLAPNEGESSGVWSSYAIGDCCLIQMREERVHVAFPLNTSASFNDRPRLLGSIATGPGDGVTFSRASGRWNSDDTFFLMSDAIAAWFHRDREAGGRPWESLLSLRTKGGRFRPWIDELRAGKTLKNDDVTVLRLRMLAAKV